MATSLSFPRFLRVGPGALDDLGAVLTDLDVRRPLVVTDGFLVSTGAAGRMMDLVAAAGMDGALFSDTVPDPTTESLTAAVEVLGADRKAVVCRELTKTHEQIVRGTLGELAEWASDGVLGEITVVLAGAKPKADLATLVDEVNGLVDAGAYRPVIDRIYALDEVVEATRYVESGQKTGNVVLRIVEAVTAPSPASGLSATAGDRPAAREARS